MLENDGELVAVNDWSRCRSGSCATWPLRPGGPCATLQGDAWRTLPTPRALALRLGVYYYDNGHAYEQQLDGLRLIEPLFVDGALVIVDNTDWERVERAVDDYVAEQQRATEILRLDG